MTDSGSSLNDLEINKQNTEQPSASKIEITLNNRNFEYFDKCCNNFLNFRNDVNFLLLLRNVKYFFLKERRELEFCEFIQNVENYRIRTVLFLTNIGKELKSLGDFTRNLKLRECEVEFCANELNDELNELKEEGRKGDKPFLDVIKSIQKRIVTTKNIPLKIKLAYFYPTLMFKALEKAQKHKFLSIFINIYTSMPRRLFPVDIIPYINRFFKNSKEEELLTVGLILKLQLSTIFHYNLRVLKNKKLKTFYDKQIIDDKIIKSDSLRQVLNESYQISFDKFYFTNELVNLYIICGNCLFLNPINRYSVYSKIFSKKRKCKYCKVLMTTCDILDVSIGDKDSTIVNLCYKSVFYIFFRNSTVVILKRKIFYFFLILRV